MSVTRNLENENGFTIPYFFFFFAIATTVPILQNSTFSWPSLQTTPSGMQGNDLIPIIIGAALGGLVVVVLSGYFIVQMRLRKKRAETDRENLIEQQ